MDVCRARQAPEKGSFPFPRRPRPCVETRNRPETASSHGRYAEGFDSRPHHTRDAQYKSCPCAAARNDDVLDAGWREMPSSASGPRHRSRPFPRVCGAGNLHSAEKVGRKSATKASAATMDAARPPFMSQARARRPYRHGSLPERIHRPAPARLDDIVCELNWTHSPE